MDERENDDEFGSTAAADAAGETVTEVAEATAEAEKPAIELLPGGVIIDNRSGCKLEGDHQFLAVTMVAFPHDTASIHREDFNPTKHILARDHLPDAVNPQWGPGANDAAEFQRTLEEEKERTRKELERRAAEEGQGITADPGDEPTGEDEAEEE